MLPPASHHFPSCLPLLRLRRAASPPRPNLVLSASFPRQSGYSGLAARPNRHEEGPHHQWWWISSPLAHSRKTECAAPRAHGGTALPALSTAALLPAAATTGILRSCAAAELLRATLSPPVSGRRHRGLPWLVRDLRKLRKPETPGRGTRRRRAVLADTGLSSSARRSQSPCQLGWVAKPLRPLFCTRAVNNLTLEQARFVQGSPRRART